MASEKRIFISNLPRDIEVEEVRLLFKKFGYILAIGLIKRRTRDGCDYRNAFVHFVSHPAAEAALARNGHKYRDCVMRVEFYRDRSRPRDRDFSQHQPNKVNVKTSFRLRVSGIPESTTWEELNGRVQTMGKICYAEIKKSDRTGNVEFLKQDDILLRALREMDGTKIKIEKGESGFDLVIDYDSDNIDKNDGNGGRRSTSPNPRWKWWWCIIYPPSPQGRVRSQSPHPSPPPRRIRPSRSPPPKRRCPNRSTSLSPVSSIEMSRSPSPKGRSTPRSPLSSLSPVSSIEMSRFPSPPRKQTCPSRSPSSNEGSTFENRSPCSETSLVKHQSQTPSPKQLRYQSQSPAPTVSFGSQSQTPSPEARSRTPIRQRRFRSPSRSPPPKRRYPNRTTSVSPASSIERSLSPVSSIERSLSPVTSIERSLSPVSSIERSRSPSRSPPPKLGFPSRSPSLSPVSSIEMSRSPSPNGRSSSQKRLSPFPPPRVPDLLARLDRLKKDVEYLCRIEGVDPKARLHRR